MPIIRMVVDNMMYVITCGVNADIIIITNNREHHQKYGRSTQYITGTFNQKIPCFSILRLPVVFLRMS